MLRKRRGLSAIIGGVFMIIIMSTAITYVSFSMNQITQLAETIGVQQEIKTDKTSESFDVVEIRTDNSQFNMTIKNTGEIPVHLTRLWIENSTDPTWPISKFDLDIAIAPGDSVIDIGQNIGLTALDSQSYFAQIITDRGNQKQMFLNSVGDSSLFLRLTATPAIMPTGFSTTVTLEVVNTGTTQLLNLQPEMVSVTTPTCAKCSTPVEEISAVPASYSSLSPGDTALFEWLYSYDGTNGDDVTFEAGILNDPDSRTDTFTVTLQTVESSLNADVSLESGGLGDQSIIGNGVLIFHMETTTGGVYQMYSGTSDAGSDGDLVRFTDPTPTPHFLTNNQTITNRIPAGDWEFAMMLSSEPFGVDVDNTADLIYHFEDGDNTNPVNSQGDTSRNLMGCGIDSSVELVSAADDAAHQHDWDGNTHTAGDMEIACNGDCSEIRLVGFRFTNVDIDRLEQINSVYLQFVANEGDSLTSNVRIYGELPSDGDADEFDDDGDEDISDRIIVGGSSDPTTAYVDWMNIPAWSTDEHSGDTTTPDLTAIISEITSHANWSNGNDLVIILVDHPTSPSDGQRKARAHSESFWNGVATVSAAPTLTSNHGAGIYPDWVADSGPHGSGSFLFDGVDECFKSVEVTNTSDGNNIQGGYATTSFWFKTTDNDASISEDMYLVNWAEPGCPNCEHYRVFLQAGAAGTAGGKIEFNIANDDGGVNDEYNCVTDNDYDDAQWHHVTASIHADSDWCKLKVKNLDGTNVEYESDNEDESGAWVDLVDGYHWNVGGNEEDDANYFKGYIDDVIHWNDVQLIIDDSTPDDADDVGRTNYGDGAHQFNVYVDVVDQNGLNPVSVSHGSNPLSAAFADPKTDAATDDLDSAYTQINMTLVSMPEVLFAEQERLDVYMTWVSPTATWEALGVDMKIDDSDVGSPYPSYLQIQPPDEAFPSYYEHDNDDEFGVYVVNSGTDGIFMTYQGTRVSFNGTAGSFAGLIHSVNGTGLVGTAENDPDDSCATHCYWNLDQDHDSVYVPIGASVKTYYHVATNVPSVDLTGTIMPAGKYDVTVWLNGYSDQGESFLRSIYVGTVDVED